MSGAAAWADALAALTLFATDPVGLGGIELRAGAGPVRDRWLVLLREALPAGTPVRRLPLNTGDDRLLGGLDLAATLQASRPVEQKGLLSEADGGVVLLAMAERVEPGVAARLCAVMDLGEVALLRDGLSRRLPARFGLVALDEGIAPDEATPRAVQDRLAFRVDLTEVTLGDLRGLEGRPNLLPLPLREGAGGRGLCTGSATVGAKPLPTPPPSPLPQGEGEVEGRPNLLPLSQREGEVEGRPNLLPLPLREGAGGRGPRTGSATVGAKLLPTPPPNSVPQGEEEVVQPRTAELPPDAAEVMCGTAMALGIDSLRAPILALRVAAAAAVLDGRDIVTETDLALAARLVLAPRATRMPPAEQAEAEPEETPPPPADDSSSDDESLSDRPLADVVLDAAKAALPPDLLARLSMLAAGAVRSRASGRVGQIQASLRRGRPIGTRQGELRPGVRLNVLETLKAAAPWQKLRRHAAGDGARRIEVRRDDFRIVRFQQKTETTTVFAVDASGSAALHRLGEAKGAVELLLADCYVRRDQVALIAFRGRDAMLLLPPTGSLVRAKRCLAGLPGGGATPLAAGIDAAAALADAVRRRGRTPVITFLTDGRANIGRDGTGGRPKGEAEALESAKLLRATGIASLLVDTSPRPNPFARRLAEAMGAQYLPLPYADATALSRAVRSAAAA